MEVFILGDKECFDFYLGNLTKTAPRINFQNLPDVLVIFFDDSKFHANKFHARERLDYDYITRAFENKGFL